MLLLLIFWNPNNNINNNNGAKCLTFFLVLLLFGLFVNILISFIYYSLQQFTYETFIFKNVTTKTTIETNKRKKLD